MTAGTPRRLVVLRHARAAGAPGVADVERPLTDEGLRDARTAGEWLRAHDLVPDLVVCSPARRARRTWDGVVERIGAQPVVTYDERVYDASLDDLLAVLADVPADATTVLLVGHNPGLESLVASLSGTHVPMSTCALVALDWDGASSGRVVETATPRA